MTKTRSIITYVVSLLFFLQVPALAQDSKENADFKLAINLYNDKLYDLAAEQLKQFINGYPTTAQGIEARFYLGLVQLKLKQYEDARLTFQTFALTYQDNPKAPEAWWNVGEAYANLRNFKEAALAYERVKVFHPKSKQAADALVKASEYFRLAGEPDDARRTLRIVLQEYPTSAASLAARTQLGQLYFDEGNLEQALNELKRVVESDPSPEAKAQAMLTLGNIYQSMRRTDLAQATYREIIAKHKGSSALAGAYLQLGKVLGAEGNYTDAIANYTKALGGGEPADTSLTEQALIGMGDAYAASQDFNNAVTQYSAFVKKFPSNENVPGVLWKSALASSKARNFGRSNHFCNQILKLSAPSLLKRRAMLKLASNALQQNMPGVAVQFYSAFLDQFGDDGAAPQVLWNIADLTERSLNDPRRAASSYELLASRHPQFRLADDAYMAAARCFEQLKEFDHAHQLYRELVQKYPASDYRPQAEERVKMIETFEQKEKDAGVEKLALLIGDVVSQADKVGLAYKLAEIYFYDLKNYSAAAAQFTNAINSGMTDSRFVEALYLRAKSYEYLTWTDEKYRQPAIDAYDVYVRSYTSDPRCEEAALALFQLKATSLANAYTAYQSTLGVFPNLKRVDLMVLRLAELQESADSSAAAIASYATLLRSYPSAPTAEEAQYRLIPLYLKVGLADSAATSAQAYLSQYPGGPHAAVVLDRLADLALARGNAHSSAGLYRQLLDQFPYAGVADSVRFKLARTYDIAGDFDNAIATYSELVDAETNDPFSDGSVDPALLLALGTANQSKGDFPEAKQYALRALEEQPTGELAGKAYNMLGMIARAEGSVEVATAYFRQAGAITPETAASPDIAELLYEAGDYTDAINQYSVLLQSSPTDSARLHFESRIILARLKGGELAAAEKAIAAFDKKYSQADDYLASFELERGNLFYRKEEYANARKAYDHVVGKYGDSPSAPVALYWIAKILEATDKPQEAVQQLTDLLAHHPGSSIIPRARFALGNLYYKAERWDESIKNYKQVIDDPGVEKDLLPFAMSNLIETYEAAGIFDAALALTRRYLELYPDKEDSFDKRIKIGILYQRLGYNDQSVAHLQALLEEAGSDLEGEIRYYIAEANFNKGDYQQAILDFLKVPYLVTKKGAIDWTANALYMSGQSYEKLGRYDQALQMYQQIIDRPGIDAMFKAAAKKEIDRVQLVLKQSSK
jgi:TolA-binding protein